MTVYTIYRNPSDFPGKFVARKFEDLVPDNRPTVVENILEEARAKLPKGLFWTNRADNDDPSIVEVWI